MPKLYKLLWSLAILFIIVTAITFTFGLILVGAVIASLFGTYRYYLTRKRSRNFKAWPRGFSSGEIIDMPSSSIVNLIATPIFGYLFLHYIALPELKENEEDLDYLIQYIVNGICKNNASTNI